MSIIKYRNLAGKSILPKIVFAILIVAGAGCASQTNYPSQVQPATTETVSEPAISHVATISDVALEEKTDSIRVIIKGSEPLTYNVSQKEFPLRLAVDVAGARLEAPATIIAVNKGGVAGIRLSEPAISGDPAAQIEIELDNYSVKYEILPSENDLFIDFFPTSPAQPAQPAKNIVDIVITEAEAFVQVDILADGTIKDYHLFDLVKPPRLVLDFPEIKSLMPVKEKASSSPFLKKVRLGNHPDYSRVVLDSPVPDLFSFDVISVSNGVTVFLGSGFGERRQELIAMSPSLQLSEEQKAAISDPTGESEFLSGEKKPVPKSVNAEESDKESPQLSLPSSETAAPDSEPEASVPKASLEKSPAPAVDTAEETTEMTKEEKADPAEKPTAASPSALVVLEEKETPRYTGEHISLDFKDADIRNILRLIAEVSDLNIVAGDDVQGLVTIRLMDVPWDQALEVILLSNNLGKTHEGNILRIVPIEKLNKEREATIAARETITQLEPLKKALIPVSYASINDLKDVIINAKVISPRGSIETDSRTNTMIVMDIDKNIKEIENIVAHLDAPTPQVLIEARVVQINPTYKKELGVTWEGGYTTSHDDALIGVGGSGGVAIDLAQGSVTTSGANVDLAPDVGPGVGGAISFGFLNPNFGIFQKIAAMEQDEKLNIISSPRIMTLDNQQAQIEQGVDLPYLKLSEEGVTSTEFKKATLSLEVVPHVTADKSIIMEIEVKKDQKSAQTGAGDEPGIDTRRAKTKVMVRNGQTVVIGGIYEEIAQDTERKVPFFGNLPVVGFFFKNTKNTKEKTELIIFITPSIVTIDQTVALE